MAKPLFIATERFDPSDGEKWQSFCQWAEIPGLVEVVSLDSLLCPHVCQGASGGGLAPHRLRGFPSRLFLPSGLSERADSGCFSQEYPGTLSESRDSYSSRSRAGR